MIMKGGLTSLLRGFSAPIKDAFKISHLELGNDTGGEDPHGPIGYNTPLSEFNKVYTMQLSHEDFSVVDYKTLKLELSLDGSEMIEEAVCEFLGIQDGETTEDGIFTLNNVACLGCCSLAPVMMVKSADGDESYGNLTKDSVKEILTEIRERS